MSERRFKYEEEVRGSPLNYDTWFDYIRLEESAGDVERTREVRGGRGGGERLGGEAARARRRARCLACPLAVLASCP